MPNPQPTLGHGDERATLARSGRGAIVLISGCMFSGKTTGLLGRIDQVPPSHVLAVKHRIDGRYSHNRIVSHGGLGCSAVAVDHAEEITRHLTRHIELVAIDEAHFFDETLAVVVSDLADRGLDLVLTSLHPDSWGRPFSQIEPLQAVADECVVRLATCGRCGGRADRTQRLTPIVNGDMVGGSESFEPRCRACWTPPPEPPPA